MKKFVLDFIHRGLIAASAGPIVLAVVYLILKEARGIESFSVDEICLGIFSLTALAFLAGGMNAIYQLERIPLMGAISIHGAVLYLGYLITYICNRWLSCGLLSLAVFTAVFVIGYAIIWIVIYSIIKKSTTRLNQALKEKTKISF